MADRGILFSPAMSAAIRAGRKTQTRRLTKALAGPPSFPLGGRYFIRDEKHFLVPVNPGDRLYVRENYFQVGRWVQDGLTKTGKPKWNFQAVGDPTFEPQKHALASRSKDNPAGLYMYRRLGRFMPRSCSRTWLEVTGVRVERLTQISEEDAKAEGAPCIGADGGPDPDERSYVWGFSELWDSIHTADGETWSHDPWVYITEFIVHDGNIDEARP